MEELLKSVYDTQDEILKAVVKLHVPAGIEADLTYGNGGFWKALPKPKYRFDINPQEAGVKKADSRKLPLADASLQSAAFDPPFLCYMRDGKSSSKRKPALAKTATSIMSGRFGGYWAYPELASHYKETLAEAARVLVKKGFFVVKCQDIIHNHQMFCTHANTIEWAAAVGFRLADLFILTKSHRIAVRAAKHGRQTQKHARIHHCYFLVFQKK